MNHAGTNMLADLGVHRDQRALRCVGTAGFEPSDPVLRQAHWALDLPKQRPASAVAAWSRPRWLLEDAAGARDQYAALLPIPERVPGAEHPDTLTTRNNLAYWTEQAGGDAGHLN